MGAQKDNKYYGWTLSEEIFFRIFFFAAQCCFLSKICLVVLGIALVNDIKPQRPGLPNFFLKKKI